MEKEIPNQKIEQIKQLNHKNEILKNNYNNLKFESQNNYNKLSDKIVLLQKQVKDLENFHFSSKPRKLFKN